MIGIYCLRFEGTNKVYIGQSIDIDKRYNSHKYAMINGYASSKLMEAYHIYGVPSMHILIECEARQLDVLEDEYIIKYNSVTNGFNFYNTSGTIHFGEEAAHCNHKNEDIIAAFNLLIKDIKYSFQDIANITGVSKNTISHISRGSSHTWLSTMFPEKYVVLLSLKGKRNINNKFYNYPELIDSYGTIYKINSASAFAKEKGLNQSAVSAVLRGSRLSHKGFKLHK